MEKDCNKCGVSKPLEEYRKHKDSRDGRRHTCKTCTAAREKEILDANPAYRKRRSQAATKTKSDFTDEDWNKKLAKERERYNQMMANPQRKSKYNQKRRELDAEYRENLSDKYIKRLLASDGDLSFSDISDELVETKRKQLILKRHVKESKD